MSDSESTADAQHTAAPAAASPKPAGRALAIIVIVLGAIFVVAGAGTWVVISNTLAEENITVADDADHFAGQQVDQPWTAYAQANVIEKHATEIGGGKTYAELDQDDPKRATVMNASFLRASLFTSVVAFGVALAVFGIGVTVILIGIALLKTSRVRI